MFVIYTPPFHHVFGGSHKLLPLYWLIPIAFGFLILAWASVRVLLARRSIERTLVKDIKGLSMCKSPTWLSSNVRTKYILDSPNDAYDEYALTALNATLLGNRE
jgi:sodium/potassium-transporting ATPase subunit alpha